VPASLKPPSQESRLGFEKRPLYPGLLRAPESIEVTRGCFSVHSFYNMTVRVLIVDDQEPFRAVARMVVEFTDGFEVVGEAVTGEDSVISARALKPDLVLMDVNLPGINGLQATEQILAEPAPPVVLVLSTYEPDEYAPRAMGVGAAAYIPKSIFDPEVLAEAWEAAAPRTNVADFQGSTRDDKTTTRNDY
jgi:two-component system invasion response regulator UvrY